MPVIVEVALEFPAIDSYFPRSAEHEADNIFDNPLSKNPKKNIDI